MLLFTLGCIYTTFLSDRDMSAGFSYVKKVLKKLGHSRTFKWKK